MRKTLIRNKGNAGVSGLILLNKVPGVTSFQALNTIKRALGTGKVGHTGTLDKFARGLLVVLAGNALKLAPLFSGCDKKYTAQVCFGAETDTLDPEGKITAQSPLPSRKAVEEAIPFFTGKILQTPPEYSAIHINGKRASDLARQGTMPEMKKRPVTIYSLELVSWQPPFAVFFVHCSSGTYIRSLARDLAVAAGSRGYLTALERTAVAGFSLNDAVREDFFIAPNPAGTEGPIKPADSEDGLIYDGISGILRPIDRNVMEALGLPWIEVSQPQTAYILNGRPLEDVLENPENIALRHGAAGGKNRAEQGCPPETQNVDTAIFFQEKLIAIVAQSGGKWKYRCVFAN
jgi:tRNA pseudouridine55 synthase